MSDATQEYLDLEVRIHHTIIDGQYPVTVRETSTGRQVDGIFVSPFSQLEITHALNWMDQGIFDAGYVQEFGAALFNALFTNKVKTVYEETHQSTRGNLCLSLIIDAPEIARIPWELLYDPQRSVFLALDAPLVRGSSLTKATRPIQVEKPLRVLVIDAFPKGVRKVENQLDAVGVRGALSDLVRERKLTVDILPFASLRKLQNTLREADTPQDPQPFLVLQIIGHGQCNLDSWRTVMLFEDEQGEIDEVDVDTLVNLLRPHHLQLVFLTICHSSRSSSLCVSEGFAPALMAGGVPAVISMQGSVLDEVAVQCFHDLYAALAGNNPIDDTILNARQLLYGARRRKSDMGIPICYQCTKTADGSDTQLRGRLLRNMETWRPLLRHQLTPRRLVTNLMWLLTATTAVLTFYLRSVEFFTPPAQTPVPPMNKDFNIAIAEFGRIDAQKGVIPSDDGRALSEEVFATVNTVAEELETEGFEIGVQSPLMTGRVEASDQMTIDENAAALAKAINADLLIYGNLDFRNNLTSLVPMLHLSNAKLLNAEELGGEYEFGLISANGNIENNPVARKDMRELLPGPSKALAHLVIGLGYFALDKFDESFNYFEKSLQSGELDDRGEVIANLFLGSTSVLRNDLPAAQEYFADSLELDARYARALLGAAQIHFLEARDDCQPGQVGVDGLFEAIEGYEEALRGRQPRFAEIPAKTALLTGRAYLCLSLAQVADHWQDAESEYTKIIEEYDLEGNVQIRNIAAEASADLGLLYLLKMEGPTSESYHLAHEAYQRAIELSTHLDRQAVFTLWIAQIHLSLQECSLASEALTQTDETFANFRSINPNIDRPEFERFHQEILSQLNKVCPASSKNNDSSSFLLYHYSR